MVESIDWSKNAGSNSSGTPGLFAMVISMSPAGLVIPGWISLISGSKLLVESTGNPLGLSELELYAWLMPLG